MLKFKSKHYLCKETLRLVKIQSAFLSVLNFFQWDSHPLKATLNLWILKGESNVIVLCFTVAWLCCENSVQKPSKLPPCCRNKFNRILQFEVLFFLWKTYTKMKFTIWHTKELSQINISTKKNTKIIQTKTYQKKTN